LFADKTAWTLVTIDAREAKNRPAAVAPRQLTALSA